MTDGEKLQHIGAWVMSKVAWVMSRAAAIAMAYVMLKGGVYVVRLVI